MGIIAAVTDAAPSFAKEVIVAASSSIVAKRPIGGRINQRARLPR
ncbi:hypothetical protein [Sphingomonas sp.]